MKNYIPVKKSQLAIYKEIPFYYLSKKGEGVLFKKAGVFISKKELDQAKTMEVYIHRRDRDRASKEMIDSLNMALAKKIASKGFGRSDYYFAILSMKH